MGWFWKITLLLVTVFSSSTVSKSLNFTDILRETVPVRDQLAECLLSIINNPKEDLVTNVRILVKVESQVLRKEFMFTVERFCASNHKVAVDIDSDGELTYTVDWRFYFIDSLNSLEFLIKWQRERDDDFGAEKQNYLIVLPDDVPSTGPILKEMFEFCWKSFIINVNILIKDRYGVVTLYTYFPFTKTSCRDTSPTIHNRFTDGRFERDQLTFPSKMKNLWQCPLTAITWNEPPFLALSQNRISGLLGDTYGILTETMNFSIQVELSPGGRGEVYSKENATAGFKMLNDEMGDFMLGASACVKVRKDFFGSTYEHYVFYVNLVLKKSKAYSPLEILFFPFDLYTWIAILVLFAGKWIGTFLWSRNVNEIAPCRDYSTRLLKISWLFCILILHSSYEGSVFKFLHNRPYRVLPNNLDEAIEQGYRFIAQESFKRFLNQIPGLRNKIVNLDTYTEDASVLFNGLEGKYGLLGLSEYLSLLKVNNSAQDYYFVPEPVFLIFQCTYLPKFSFLTTEFNNRFFQLMAHGYMAMFHRKFPSLSKSTTKKRPKDDHEKMSMEQLMGGFQILFMLSAVSLCVFAMEVLSRKCKSLKIIMEFLQ